MKGIDRRTFMLLTGAGLATPLLGAPFASSEDPDPAPVLKIGTDPEKPLIPFLSWDTEGGKRAEQNLLRDHSQVSLRIRTGGAWRPAEQFSVRRLGKSEADYAIDVGPDATLGWRVLQDNDVLRFNLSATGRRLDAVTGIEMRFPFNPRLTPTTLLPSVLHEDGSFNLPGILSAPDFGQMFIAPSAGAEVKGRLMGDREQGTTDLILELPLPAVERPLRIELRPVRLDPPDGLRDQALWRLAPGTKPRRPHSPAPEFPAFQPHEPHGSIHTN